MCYDLIYNNFDKADRLHGLIRQSIQLLSALILMDLIRGLIMKSKLTYERLHELLHYNPKTGLFTRKKSVGRNGRHKTGTIVGCRNTKGYNVTTIDSVFYRMNRLAFLYMEGYFPENQVDHKNQITWDDRWCNLREITNVCNIRNSGNPKNNTSGVKGVSLMNRNSKWVAYMTINCKRKVLGEYRDFDDAVCARLAGEQCVGWEGCESNSPAYQYVKKHILKRYQ